MRLITRHHPPTWRLALRSGLLLVVTATLVTIATATAGQGNNGVGGAQGQANTTYAVGLWGDLPYSDVQANVGLPNLLADMNSQKLAFTVHDGDLKAGSGSPCNDELYFQALAYFNTLEAPAMFTPGDNDWVDCDRPANGGFSSLERLTRERQIFFNSNKSMGQRTLTQEVQSSPTCLGENQAHARFPEACVENRRWVYGRVTYATLNIQGSCNNLCDTSPDAAEYAARNAANIDWLHETFAAATMNGSVGVMLITQANTGFDGSDPTRAPLRNPLTLAQTDGQPDGFRSFLVALRENVTAFRKPVAFVHGDSHYFRVDRPLQNAVGQRLENFTRVETFGDNAPNLTNDVNWLKVIVDPTSREVFSYQVQIVPANRVAVPAP